eukprot:6075057-Prymnesium_polylepis.1
MMFGVPPWKLEHVEPANGAADGAQYTKIQTTTGTFNGLYGTPRFPKIGDESERYTQDEVDAMTAQAKLTLEQVWRTEKIKHNLISKGWHKLPYGHGLNKNRLPASVAVPRAAKRRLGE